MTVLLDPTGEMKPAQRELLPRPDSLAEKTVGMLDISKPRGDIFLDHLEANWLIWALPLRDTENRHLRASRPWTCDSKSSANAMW